MSGFNVGGNWWKNHATILDVPVCFRHLDKRQMDVFYSSSTGKITTWNDMRGLPWPWENDRFYPMWSCILCTVQRAVKQMCNMLNRHYQKKEKYTFKTQNSLNLNFCLKPRQLYSKVSEQEKYSKLGLLSLYLRKNFMTNNFYNNFLQVRAQNSLCVNSQR